MAMVFKSNECEGASMDTQVYLLIPISVRARSIDGGSRVIFILG